MITGASSGIGLEYARVMAGKGYNLVVVSNEEERIGETGKWLEMQYGVEVCALYMDLAVAEAPEKLYAICLEKGIEVEVLINNAGIFYLGEVAEGSPGLTEKMLLLHVNTPTMLCRLFGKDMKARGHGYILNMSSLSAWLPCPGIALYASTKNYLKSFSRAFRSELYDYHVSVTVLCPGAVATDLYHLSHRLQRLAVRLGIMMEPGKLAARGVRAMFRKRATVVPGFINHLFIPLVCLLPSGLVRWGMRKSGLLPLVKQNGI